MASTLTMPPAVLRLSQGPYMLPTKALLTSSQGCGKSDRGAVWRACDLNGAGKPETVMATHTAWSLSCVPVLKATFLDDFDQQAICVCL